MTNEHAATDVPNSPPDWAALTVELACPRCGYNLRMLTVARCPECGLHFRWSELLQEAEDAQAGRWTFEYQWRSRPIKAFFQTVLCCLLPWKMWTRLPLSATPRVGPLLLMIPVAVLLIVLTSAAVDLAQHEHLKLYNARVFGQRGAGFPWVWSWTAYTPLVQLATGMLLCVSLWLAIQVFRQTIARYRIRHAHILRVLVYTWIGVVVWRSLIEAVLTIGEMPYVWWLRRAFPSIVFSITDLIPSIVLVTSIALAFSTYLRVRGGLMWAFVILLFATVLVTLSGVAISVLWYQAFSNPFWDALAEWVPLFRRLSSATESAFLRVQGWS